METTETTIESLIAAVLCDIRQQGYSSVQPFCIGKVEERMMLFAQNNAITLASDALYMSAKQLQHCMRASKASKGLVSKFIVHPNYKMKISREFVAHVNFDGTC